MRCKIKILEDIEIRLSLSPPLDLKQRGVRQLLDGFSDGFIRERDVSTELGEAGVARAVSPGVAQQRHVDQLGVGADGQPEDVVRNASEPPPQQLILDNYIWVVTQRYVRT